MANWNLELPFTRDELSWTGPRLELEMTLDNFYSLSTSERPLGAYCFDVYLDEGSDAA